LPSVAGSPIAGSFPTARQVQAQIGARILLSGDSDSMSFLLQRVGLPTYRSKRDHTKIKKIARHCRRVQERCFSSWQAISAFYESCRTSSETVDVLFVAEPTAGGGHSA
jgi:hypothetical protein